MESNLRVQSAYLVWLALMWDALEQAGQSTRIDPTKARSVCQERLAVVQLELHLQCSVVDRLHASGAIRGCDAEQITELAQAVHDILPGNDVPLSRAVRTIRAAQNRVLAEVLYLGGSHNLALRQA